MTSSKKTYYQGVRFMPYDLVRELLVLLLVVTALVVILSGFLSSPDVPPLTLKRVAVGTPLIFTQTALDMLDGNSDISSYGPPYNAGTGSVQFIGPFSPAQLFGVRIPINTSQDYVIKPLTSASADDPALAAALNTFESASLSSQASWENAYNTALGAATSHGAVLTVPSCTCGPIPGMMTAELKLGQSGAMDGLLLTSNRFYQTDFTRPLLFMQNDAVGNLATKLNLQGDTWGAMNETGNYPGQEWLWLYTLFYQIPPYTTAWAANTDLLAVVSITILTLILMLMPWIPGLKNLPRYLGVYRLIWRDYYREQREHPEAAATSP